ncbi:hypothetical protein HanXRQr2_Chr06g0270831 [Helianthus annuus]|uniref:Uncharacterized protein n=1 Tax=Helianthus annuus TaxID=4232 RepID=A0A9K3IWF9_HELAN|nr:hypothetical protein HanXRQr2_Chr06g0270831 [Helianthus annuus]KAJ0916412.1 hypothetical protein HanPSC8_Chr06g0261411 [Helianthus annuus]
MIRTRRDSRFTSESNSFLGILVLVRFQKKNTSETIGVTTKPRYVPDNLSCSSSWNSPFLLVRYLQEIATQPLLIDQYSRKQARMVLETHFSN